MLVSLPVETIFEVRAVIQDRGAIRNGKAIHRLSQRHLERAIGRFIALLISTAIGASALRQPFQAPTTVLMWLVLFALFYIPAWLRVDGIRDMQLRRALRLPLRPRRMGTAL